jgi:predicted kinase
LLYIFGGLPGVGKSTLARQLARELQAVHLRLDTIEHALREAGHAVIGPEGYTVAYRVAVDNLRLGLNVVADSVNPLRLTRAAWRAAARQAAAPFVEIQVICSDVAEHRGRVETRVADIPGFTLPTWKDVIQREVEAWEPAPLTIDTAGKTPEQSAADLRRALAGLDWLLAFRLP